MNWLRTFKAVLLHSRPRIPDGDLDILDRVAELSGVPMRKLKKLYWQQTPGLNYREIRALMQLVADDTEGKVKWV